MRNNLYIRAAIRFLLSLVYLGVLLFLPAGALDYWEAWLSAAVFIVCDAAITIWLMVNDPHLLKRRMRAGSAAEKEPAQKIIMRIARLSVAGSYLIPAFDHRFGWSDVPASVVILGNILIALSHVFFYFAFRENTYCAATIQAEKNQSVISTGSYALVRHPMYIGVVITMIGTPLALGSWWGLLMVMPSVAALIWRIPDEEKFLSSNLAGYVEYKSKVRYRLIPFVW